MSLVTCVSYLSYSYVATVCIYSHKLSQLYNYVHIYQVIMIVLLLILCHFIKLQLRKIAATAMIYMGILVIIKNTVAYL